MRKTLSAVLAAAMTVVLAAGCGGEKAGGSGDGLTSVTVGIVPFSPNAVLFNAMDNGIFAKHGLKVTTVSAAAPTPIVAAMVSGQQQFGFITTPVLLNVNAEGTGLKCVTPVDGQISKERDASALVASAKSGVTDIKGLAGRKVAVVQLSSINLIGAKKLAEQAGVTNIEWVAIPFPQMPQALADGRVDGAVITSPYLDTAVKAGAKKLAYPSSQLWPEGTIYCYGATDNYLKGHPDVAKKFHDAMTEAIEYAKDHESEIKKTLTTHLKLSPDQAQKQVLPTNYVPEINVASIASIQDTMLQQGAIKKKVDPQTVVWTPQS